MQRHDDLNVPMMAFWGVFSCIVTFVLILAIQVGYYRVANEETERKVISAVYADSESVLAAQDAKLVRYGWLNRDTGVVAIPIDRAMELVVREGVSALPVVSEAKP